MEIGSYARAQGLLKQGHTYLDRDGEGWPANRCCEPVRPEPVCSCLIALDDAPIYG